MLLGALVGGAGSLLGGLAGAAVNTAFGAAASSSGTIVQYALSGAAQGALAGAGTGAAIGFATDRGHVGPFFLSLLKSAAWGAAFGAVVAGGLKAALTSTGGGMDDYLEITAKKWDPSTFLESPVQAFDHWAGAGEDYATEAIDISAGKGFNGNGITEFVSTGNIAGGTGQFSATWAPLSGNVGGVLIWQGGALIAIPIGWVPSVLPTFGIAVLTNLSIFGDYSGIISYAGQLDLFLNVAPIVDLALLPADWINSIPWQSDKSKFNNVFSKNPQPVPESS